MKLLFSCDDYCYCADGKYYFREFGDILIKRYLEVFETIRVAVRTKYVSIEELGIFNILADPRVEVYPLPFFQGPAQYFSVYFETRKRLKTITDNCDVCIVRMPSSIAYAVLYKVKEKRMPYAVEVVANPLELSLQGGLKNLFFWNILHKNLLKACAEADCSSYVTEYTLQKIYPPLKQGNYSTFYSSVDLSQNMFVGSRSGFNLPFTICHVSHHIPLRGKGHDTLLKVAAELVRKGFNIRVKIAGDGSHVDYFKQMAVSFGIVDKVEFVGFLKRDGLRELLLSSDLMLFPTLTEGLPRVIIEAMATGMPCLSTPVGGIPELLNTDYLFRHDDVEGFTGKIAHLIEDKELYKKQSEINYKKSLKYSSDVLMEKRIAMYKNLRLRVK